MSNYEFHLPDIGEGLHEAEILSWFVKVGDQVKEHDNLAEIQTDKAAVEITSPVSGRIVSLGAEEGETLKVGDVLVSFSDLLADTNKAEAVSEAEKKEETEVKSVEHVATVTNQNQTGINRILAAPSVRKKAREAGISLADITATGPNGRVLAKDLQTYIDQAQSEPTTFNRRSFETNDKPQTIEEPIKGLRKIIYHNMQKTTSTAALCTGMDEVNVTKLVQLRNELKDYTDNVGIRLTYLPFIIKAVAFALKKHPIFNAHIDDENMKIIYHNDVHIGIATATDDGLLVPVIRHADQKSIIEIAEEIAHLSEKAKNKQLNSNDLTGSTFTISSTGAAGGQYATPIINYPELAILGVHQIKRVPIVEGDSIGIGNMMGMSITFDHRIIDGEPSGLFMNEIGQLLNNPARMLLHL